MWGSDSMGVGGHDISVSERGDIVGEALGERMFRPSTPFFGVDPCQRPFGDCGDPSTTTGSPTTMEFMSQGDKTVVSAGIDE